MVDVVEPRYPTFALLNVMDTNPFKVPLNYKLLNVDAIRLLSLTWDTTTFTPPWNTLWLECDQIISNQSCVGMQGAAVLAVLPLQPNLTVNETHRNNPVWRSTVDQLTVTLMSPDGPVTVTALHKMQLSLIVQCIPNQQHSLID